MSAKCKKLISQILNEHFGEDVEKIGTCIFQNKFCGLSRIVQITKLPSLKVKKSLCTLINQGFVTFKHISNTEKMMYELQSDKVLLILRFSKYQHLIKNLFGTESELFINEILYNGFQIGSDLILTVYKRLKVDGRFETNINNIYDKFIALVTAKYLIRHPLPCDELSESEQFLIPTINIDQLILKEHAKEVDVGDSKIFWDVNFDRFHQEFRDELLISAITRKVDDNAGVLLKIMLQLMYGHTEPWENTSKPIFYEEIKKLVRNSNACNYLSVYLDQYLKVLCSDETKFISQCSEDQYVINLKTAVNQICWSVLENIVHQKYSLKAARIFRLIKFKEQIEVNKIWEIVMMSASKTNILLFKLLEDNWVMTQDYVSKSRQTSKSSTFVYINLDQIVRMNLEICYKTLYNLMVRRSYIKSDNRVIINKKIRIDLFVQAMHCKGGDAEDKIKDIEDLITEPEIEIFNKVEKDNKTLNQVELEIDDTMFIFTLFLQYN